jgi:rRNA-processing protein FCF1
MATESKSVKKTLKVILDSNALFVPLQFRIDIFEELKTLLNMKFEPVVLSPIRRELEIIAQASSPKMRKLASYALELTQKCVFFEIEKEKNTCSPDDAIIEMAKKWNCPVFTNDRELRKKLRNISVPVIYVRQKSRLEIDGRIQFPVQTYNSRRYDSHST